MLGENSSFPSTIVGSWLSIPRIHSYWSLHCRASSESDWILSWVKAVFPTTAVEMDGIRVDGGCHFEGRRGHKAYKSPPFIANHNVAADHADSSLEPLPPKQAEATSNPTESKEKALFLVLPGEKSCSSEEPITSFFRSIASVGLSVDQRLSRLNSQSRTTASTVTVTRQLPATPQGCHSMLAI